MDKVAESRSAAREYARQYRERNRELLRAKAREYWDATRDRRPPAVRPTCEERFWAKVKKDCPSGCWEWQAGKSYGYGSFRLDGRAVAAHRLSWELLRGPIPPGMGVLHTCDNKPCVNPAHLYLGTDKDNARDRSERGQFVSNIHHAQAKRMQILRESKGA